MALDYSKNISPNSWSLSNSEFISKELNKRLERYKAKKEAIENLSYEQDIILNDITEVLRTDVNRSATCWRPCCKRIATRIGLSCRRD